MTDHQIVYLVFGIVLLVALVVDLGLLSKKNTTITLQKALYQTFFLGIAGFIVLYLSLI